MVVEFGGNLPDPVASVGVIAGLDPVGILSAAVCRFLYAYERVEYACADYGAVSKIAVLCGDAEDTTVEYR